MNYFQFQTTRKISQILTFSTRSSPLPKNISKCGVLSLSSVLLPCQQGSVFFRLKSSQNGENKETTEVPESWKVELREKKWDYAHQKSEFHEHIYHRVYTGECCGKNSRVTSLEAERCAYRQRWATFRLICKIEDTARKLIDDNVIDKCQAFYYVDAMDKLWTPVDVKDEERYDENYTSKFYEECWMSLLKSSKVPLATQLKDKLKTAGISESDFSQSIVKIYYLLHWRGYENELDYFERVPFGPEDIISVLKSFDSLNDTDYECIKILFNIEEQEKWHIEIPKKE